LSAAGAGALQRSEFSDTIETVSISTSVFMTHAAAGAFCLAPNEKPPAAGAAGAAAAGAADLSLSAPAGSAGFAPNEKRPPAGAAGAGAGAEVAGAAAGAAAG
jgi:hypothetical protein